MLRVTAWLVLGIAAWSAVALLVGVAVGRAIEAGQAWGGECPTP